MLPVLYLVPNFSSGYLLAIVSTFPNVKFGGMDGITGLNPLGTMVHLPLCLVSSLTWWTPQPLATFTCTLYKRNCHNDWQFVISDSDEWTQIITMRRTTWQSFPHSQPTFLHFIIPSWQLTVPMHQIGSLICNEYDKFMVKMTILFLLWQVTVSLKLAAINSESLILPVMWVIKSPQFSQVCGDPGVVSCENGHSERVPTFLGKLGPGPHIILKE